MEQEPGIASGHLSWLPGRHLPGAGGDSNGQAEVREEGVEGKEH